MAVEMSFGFVLAVKSLPSPTVDANLERREKGIGNQRRGGMEQGTRVHSADGYIALKHPAPGNPFCASKRCQESRELAVVPLGFPAGAAGEKDCVELEHADTATESAAIKPNREKLNPVLQAPSLEIVLATYYRQIAVGEHCRGKVSRRVSIG
jgi:hypothetical protein